MDKRTRARELAMQGLYELDVQGPASIDFLGRFFKENEPDDSICQTALQWVRGTWENMSAGDELITESALKWKLSRLSPVDKSILRLSIYQFMHCSDIPNKVVINEAIELAKKFSTEKSPAFVNGVLDAVLKKIKVKSGK